MCPEFTMSKMTAGQWMAQMGQSWSRMKSPPQGKKAKLASSKTKRVRRAKNLGETGAWRSVKEFVERHRCSKDSVCIFVPGAQDGVPARVEYLGKSLTAARYMLLLTQGTPKNDCLECRHLCGNGHLSCINPTHLAWGTRGDNVSDQQHHRKVGGNVQDRINSVSR